MTLKSCPFCGGKAGLIHKSESTDGLFPEEWWVACTQCRAMTKRYNDEDEAWDAWDRRV